MSASSVHSLASTQDDDVASIEWGVSTAASYTTEDESRLLNLSAITPPVAYEDDDVSEKATASPHPAPHHHEEEEEEEETVEVARRDATATRGIGQEFTARVQELLLLHESKATIKAERALCSDDEEEKEEEQASRVDSEEAGVATALEIGAPDAPASASARVPLPATPRRPDARGAGSTVSGGSGRAGSTIRGLPQPPTPRPSGTARMRSLPGLSALAAPHVHPHHPPFFAAPHRSMYGGFNPGPFGPLGYGGPSMRPFNSLPVGLPPHLAPGGGLGRPSMHHHMGGAPLPPPLPPRAYMGGGPPASLGGPLGTRGARPHYYPGQHHPLPAHALASSPYPHHLPHSFSPPPTSSSSVMGAARRTAASTPTRRDSETSPRSSASAALSTISASPRTAPASLERSHYGGRMAQSISSSVSHRDASSTPPTMAALGIGLAAAAGAVGGGGAAAAAAAASELTPYPMVYCTAAGSISCVLNHDVVVEMAVDRSVRVVLHDNFAAFCNARGTSSAILHPTARIKHTEDFVYTKFIANNEKMAVFGEQGVIFTMSHLSEAYLVNSAAYPGASAVALDQLQFPMLDDDMTIKMFYTEAQTGPQFHALCRDIVSEATYDRRPDGSLYLHINGMLIRQSTSGDVIIDARPRQISCSPSKKSIHVRSGCIDMAVEEDERGYVKRAHKRVHVSRSGMVISDGNCITSMDHFGRIVCCN